MISINKNPRYKILSSENHNYLLDLDQSFKFMLIPFFSWFCKVEVIEISNEEVSILKGNQKDVKKLSIPIGAIGIMITLTRIFRHGASAFVLDVPKIVNIAVLLIYFITIVMLRIWLSKKSKKKVASIINMDRKMKMFRVLPFRFSEESKRFYL